jgi:hypothetical protein
VQVACTFGVMHVDGVLSTTDKDADAAQRQGAKLLVHAPLRWRHELLMASTQGGAKHKNAQRQRLTLMPCRKDRPRATSSAILWPEAYHPSWRSPSRSASALSAPSAPLPTAGPRSIRSQQAVKTAWLQELANAPDARIDTGASAPWILHHVALA